MKILIVTPRFYPEPFAIDNVAFSLFNMGHEVTVLTGRANYGGYSFYNDYPFKKEETINGVKVIRYKERIRRKGIISLVLNYISTWRQSRKAFKHLPTDYDLVISHVISPIFILSGVNKFCKKHKIFHLHFAVDLFPESFVISGYFKKNSFFYKLLKKISISYYQKTDIITFSSPLGKEYINDYLGLDKPVYTVYQPTLISRPELSEIKKQYRSNGKTNLLYCGSIHPHNCLDKLLLALSDYKDDFTLTIVGGGLNDKLKNIIKEKKLDGVVKVVGRVTANDTRPFYKDADVILNLLEANDSTKYYIPQKVIESLMYGRPILALMSGAGSTLLKEAGHNIIFNDPSIPSFKEALLKVRDLKNEKLEKIGEENRGYYDNHPQFKSEETAKILLDIYEKEKGVKI